MSNVATKILVIAIIVLVVLVFLQGVSGSCVGGTYSKTKHQGLAKEAITPLGQYSINCVVDGDNWFVDPYVVGQSLKSFYDRTGIQPWVVIASTSITNGLVGDPAKEQWADTYYKNNLPHEGCLLYVYFAESDPDVEGYSVLTGGSAVKAFFDDAAIDAFWDVFDSNYYNTKLSEEEFIVNTFNGTADICLSDKTITSETSTGIAGILSKVIPVLIVGTVICIALMIVLKLVQAKNARKAAEAAETERILNTPLEKLGSDDDDLLNKYK